MWRWASAAVLALAMATAGHAQLQRQLPANGQLGELVGQRHPFPLIQIGNKVLRLAPGGRIYDEHNRTILHAFLPGYAHVLFTVDMNGDVAHLYILRPEELAQLQRSGAR